ncbi:unnamed protein product [marine sediment metagenome]|uniref:Uncharacterized protein n=1 Tax=marine sediment metagenome TaxID=412755 RepID=X1VH70_9ZZZZ
MGIRCGRANGTVMWSDPTGILIEDMFILNRTAFITYVWD